MVPGSAGEDSETSERFGGETPVSLLLCFRGEKFANLRACKLVSRERSVLLVSVFCHTINCSSLSPRWSEGEALVELYLLCHPHCSLASSTDSTPGEKLEVSIVISSLH